MHKCTKVWVYFALHYLFIQGLAFSCLIIWTKSKLLKGTLFDLSQFFTTESPLKLRENTFYFNLKALDIINILQCLSWRFGHVDKRLNWRLRLISKFMASQPRKQTNVLHILANISRSKYNQIIKLNQLIEYNMRNIFLERLYTKCGVQTISRTFSKKSKLTISLNQ